MAYVRAGNGMVIAYDNYQQQSIETNLKNVIFKVNDKTINHEKKYWKTSLILTQSILNKFETGKFLVK